MTVSSDAAAQSRQDSKTLPWRPYQLRAPEENGALLIRWLGGEAYDWPSAAASLAASNVDVQGRTLSRLRAWGRQVCLQAAAEYTSGLLGRDVSPPPAERPLFVAGHQPQLFHPGVWVKNFVLGGLCDRTEGTGLNLVVDNDTLASTGIVVPAGTPAEPRVDHIEFDASRPPQPWEDARILDPSRFDSFGDRVAAAMRLWNIDPVIERMWPDATEFRRCSARLVDCLVAARHRQERRWGLGNLELPVSRLCELPPFLWFACHVLAHLPRFCEIHNAVLWDYRRVNHIRSRSHPVPELSENDGWLEAPFWVWRAGDEHRQRVFAKLLGREIALSDGSREFARLPLAPEREACCAVEALQQLPRQGIRFRTRALTTTLFARICLGDVFVHGIGGAKYDEMTDRIISRFFGFAPPPFLVATATMRLPLTYPETPEEPSRLRHALRDTQFNPERHAVQPPPELLARKAELVAQQHAARCDGLTRRERRARRSDSRRRFLEFRELQAALAPYAAAERDALQSRLRAAEASASARAILGSREYSACLYPDEVLRELFDRARNCDLLG